MTRLCLILLIATMAPNAAALTRQQEQVISATGFALFVGDYYYPACEHYELDDETVQSAWRTPGLNPDRYMEKTHFRGNGCGAPDAVGDSCSDCCARTTSGHAAIARRCRWRGMG